MPTCTIQLIYNFTSMCVYTCGAMQYFTWKILFLPMNYDGLHVRRHDTLLCGIVYVTQDLAMEHPIQCTRMIPDTTSNNLVSFVSV